MGVMAMNDEKQKHNITPTHNGQEMEHSSRVSEMALRPSHPKRLCTDEVAYENHL